MISTPSPKALNPMEVGGKLGVEVWVPGLWLAGNDGMEKKMETAIIVYTSLGFRRNGTKIAITIMGYIGTTVSIHSVIPS